MKTKLLSLFVALVATTALWAYDCVVDGIYYNLNTTEMTATVTNETGDLYAQSYSGTVIIPSSFTYNSKTYSVTTIGDYTFAYCRGLTSITIPNSVTTIGERAFYGCSGLTSITIPNSVTTIGDWAFADCYSITSVTWNAISCQTGYRIFFETCDEISHFTFGNQVQEIPSELCYGMIKLYSITIPNSVTTIGSNVFYGCNGLTSPVYNANCFAYMPQSYKGAYTIPNGIIQIAGCAFHNCEGLTSATIPNSVTTIGNDAFYECTGLTSVTIGSSVTTIGYRAFDDCIGLTSITIPNSVTTIGAEAFSGCTGLTSITIPNSVTTIGDYAFSDVCNIVYDGIAIDEGKSTNWGARCRNGFIDGYIVYKDSTMSNLVACSSSINENVVLSNSVTSIGERAFLECKGLTSITISNSVTKIGNYAFHNCSGLTSVTIPNSITQIEEGAFVGCKNLTSISLPKTITSIGNSAFYGCGLTSIVIPFNTKTIGNSAFCTCPLKKIYIPDGVYIGDRAFFREYAFDSYYKDTVYVMFSPFVRSDLSYMKNKFKYYIYTTVYYPTMYAIPYGVSSSVSPTGFEINVDLSDIKISNKDSLSLDLMNPEKEFVLQADTQTNITIANLKPNTEYSFQFFSKDTKTNQWIDGCSWNISTPSLKFTTLTPKVVSAGTAVVAAETNISDYETNVGFEWRKYDAPESMPSKSGAAILYNGMMEGKLLNLGTDAYWNVRPYYEAADGTRYYGEWITFDPSDFSYFEPTVHTYALAISPTSNSVQVRGYVMTGTDEVTEQGFEYWINSAKAPNRVSSATSEDVLRVKASGQLMTAVLENLAYSSTYTCRAYAIAGGKTYYGEEVQFLTPEDPETALETLWSTNKNGNLATKYFHNGNLIIERNGIKYTPTGQKVR